MSRATAGLLLTFLLWGCRPPEAPAPRFPSHPPPPEQPIGARLSRSKVLAIAEKAHGKIRLEEVDMVFITAEEGRKVWRIFFPSPQPAYIGGGSIEVDDMTGKAMVFLAK